jgi:hypothetical protein
MAVYLLHFDRPYRHARHYLGYSRDLQTMHERIDAHYNATPGDGKSHRLMQVIREAGISFTLARVWPEGTREDERRMKQRGHARRCPLCREMTPHQEAQNDRVSDDAAVSGEGRAAPVAAGSGV